MALIMKIWNKKCASSSISSVRIFKLSVVQIEFTISTIMNSWLYNLGWFCITNKFFLCIFLNLFSTVVEPIFYNKDPRQNKNYKSILLETCMYKNEINKSPVDFIRNQVEWPGEEAAVTLDPYIDR